MDILKDLILENETLQQAVPLILVAVVTWFVSTFWEKHQNSKLPNSHDVEVWERIKKNFDDSTLYFLEKQDLGAHFAYSNLDVFKHLFYERVLEKPDYIFIDKELTKLSDRLQDRLQDVATVIVNDISLLENNNTRAKVKERENEEYGEGRKNYMARVDNANAVFTNFLESYNDLNHAMNRKMNKKVKITS